jgi:hypothetical protein
MKPLLRTRRENPTTCVVRRTQTPESVRTFFAAVNEAIEAINSGPGKFKGTYFERFNRVLSELPTDIREAGIGLEKKISVPRWNKWEPYTENDFNRTRCFLIWSKNATRFRESSSISKTRFQVKLMLRLSIKQQE